MLKKTRGSCLCSHPLGPHHLRSFLTRPFKVPKALGGTGAPSSVTQQEARPPLRVPGGTQSMTLDANPLDAALPALSLG